MKAVILLITLDLAVYSKTYWIMGIWAFINFIGEGKLDLIRFSKKSNK
jgi:hypothetical protein